MKRPSIFKLFIILYLLISVCAIFTIAFTSRDIRKTDIDIVRNSLEYYGLSLLPSLSSMVKEHRYEELEEFIKEIGAETDKRITVIDVDGMVIGESERIASYMDDHSNRPEVIQALGGKTGTSIRYSNSLQAEMLYVALPMTDEGRISGVLRVSMHVKSIESLSRDIRLKVFLLASLVILLSISGVLLFFTRLINPLDQLSEVARRGAQGDFDARIFLKNEDTLKEIADNYNQMIDKVKTLLTEFSLRKEELGAILSSMQPGLLVLNRSNEIAVANESAERIIHANGILGSKYWHVLREPKLFRLIERVQAEKTTAREEVGINDGIFQVSAAYIQSLNETVLVFHDITEIKNLEQIKKEFVLNVSHELRTPLTAIKGYAETIEETDTENLKYLEIIKRHTDRLINIVEDLLVLSELEEKELISMGDTFHLESVIDQVLKMFEGKLKTKNLKLSLEVQKDLPPVRGDLMKMEQVLINLVDNAIKYTEKGQITISLRMRDGSIELKVKDTGIGIPAEHLPRIFERFYTVDKSHSRRVGGTGLGLSIVKHIVHLHGGSINVESEPGMGSTFTIRYPTTHVHHS